MWSAGATPQQPPQNVWPYTLGQSPFGYNAPSVPYHSPHHLKNGKHDSRGSSSRHTESLNGYATLSSVTPHFPEKHCKAFIEKTDKRGAVVFRSKNSASDMETPASPVAIVFSHDLPMQGLVNGLDLSHSRIKCLPTQFFQYMYATMTSLSLAHNQLTDLPPLPETLLHLDISHNQLSQLPCHLGTLQSLVYLNISHNKLSILPVQLTLLDRLKTLIFDHNEYIWDDVTSMSKGPRQRSTLLHLFSTLKQHHKGLLPCPSTNTLPPTFSLRPWYTIATSASTTSMHSSTFEGHPSLSRSSPSSIRVLSYNILCPKYVTYQAFPYCSAHASHWSRRRTLLRHELLASDADIISLQEVELAFFEDDLHPLLQDTYGATFSVKSRSFTMDTEEDRRSVDGCAIFYRASRFHLIDQKEFRFPHMARHILQQQQQQQQHNHPSVDTEMLLQRVTTKDNLATACLLQLIDPIPTSNPPRHLLVINAHLHWDPAFRDVKLLQAILLMHGIDVWLKTRHASLCASSPPALLLCGDLNSLPESGVVSFLLEGTISADHVSFLRYNYGAVLGDACLSHRFSLASAYRMSVTRDDALQRLLRYRPRPTTPSYTPIVLTDIHYEKEKEDGHSRCLVSYVSEEYKRVTESSNDLQEEEEEESARVFLSADLPWTNYTSHFQGVIDYIFYSRAQLKRTAWLDGVSQRALRELGCVGLPNEWFPSDHIPLLVEFVFENETSVEGQENK